MDPSGKLWFCFMWHIKILTTLGKNSALLSSSFVYGQLYFLLLSVSGLGKCTTIRCLHWHIWSSLQIRWWSYLCRRLRRCRAVWRGQDRVAAPGEGSEQPELPAHAYPGQQAGSARFAGAGGGCQGDVRAGIVQHAAVRGTSGLRRDGRRTFGCHGLHVRHDQEMAERQRKTRQVTGPRGKSCDAEEIISLSVFLFSCRHRLGRCALGVCLGKNSFTGTDIVAVGFQCG